MSAYVTQVKELFHSHANPTAAGPMAAYMRDQFAFLGMQSALIGQLNRQAVAEWGLPALSELDAILRELWDEPEREFQYFALGLLNRSLPGLPAGWSSTLEYLVTHKSWWDTVDTIAISLVGPYFKRFPAEHLATLPDWRASEDIWLRRVAILFQNNYKLATDFTLLKDIILENLGSREFFINKAIGWSLRTYSRVNADGVRAFVANTPLHPLSKREALKWLENHPSAAPKP